MAAWKNVKGELNKSGVPLVLTLARYFKRWSLWSKDIIFLFTPDSIAGPQAWVDAYHDAHDSSRVASLPLKSGALQGAIALDFSREDRFKSVHIVYDGVNGQLPNLDLINSVNHVAGGQMGMGVAIQEMWKHSTSYHDRLQTMLRGMLKQGLGLASGPHSSFIPYHVDAVTLQPFGDGWQDEMAIGRVIEGTFRSLNNLLEHLHQSFFFYLLMQKERFVSIGTYLPSAMLVAANFTIMAIALWVKSGQPEVQEVITEKTETAEEAEKVALPNPHIAVERDLLVPLVLVTACQFAGVVPLYLFNHLSEGVSLAPLPTRCLYANMTTGSTSSLRPLLHPLCRSPIPSLQPPPHLDNFNHNPTVPSHPLLFSAPPRHVPFLARDPQLLPRLPRRRIQRSSELRPPLPQVARPQMAVPDRFVRLVPDHGGPGCQRVAGPG